MHTTKKAKQIKECDGTAGVGIALYLTIWHGKEQREGRGFQAGLQKASYGGTGAQMVLITHSAFEQLSNTHLGDVSIAAKGD